MLFLHNFWGNHDFPFFTVYLCYVSRILLSANILGFGKQVCTYRIKAFVISVDGF